MFLSDQKKRRLENVRGRKEYKVNKNSDTLSLPVILE